MHFPLFTLHAKWRSLFVRLSVEPVQCLNFCWLIHAPMVLPLYPTDFNATIHTLEESTKAINNKEGCPCIEIRFKKMRQTVGKKFLQICYSTIGIVV